MQFYSRSFELTPTSTYKIEISHYKLYTLEKEKGEKQEDKLFNVGCDGKGKQFTIRNADISAEELSPTGV